jgi:hypothetical protein
MNSSDKKKTRRFLYDTELTEVDMVNDSTQYTSYFENIRRENRKQALMDIGTFDLELTHERLKELRNSP